MEESEGTNWDLKDPQYAKWYFDHGDLYLVYKDGQKYAMAHPESGMMTDVVDRKLSDEEMEVINKKIKMVQRIKSEKDYSPRKLDKDEMDSLEQDYFNVSPYNPREIGSL